MRGEFGSVWFIGKNVKIGRLVLEFGFGVTSFQCVLVFGFQ